MSHFRELIRVPALRQDRLIECHILPLQGPLVITVSHLQDGTAALKLVIEEGIRIAVVRRCVFNLLVDQFELRGVSAEFDRVPQRFVAFRIIDNGIQMRVPRRIAFPDPLRDASTARSTHRRGQLCRSGTQQADRLDQIRLPGTVRADQDIQRPHFERRRVRAEREQPA